MAQIVPCDAALGVARARQPVGYRVLDINHREIAPFTRANVHEIPVGSGCYTVAGGVSIPDDGGYIVWGLDGGKLLGAVAVEASPVATMPALLDGLAVRIADELDKISEAQRADLATTARQLHDRLGVLSDAQTGNERRIGELRESIGVLGDLPYVEHQLTLIAKCADYLEESGVGVLLKLIERIDGQRIEGQRRMHTIAEIDKLIEAMDARTLGE